jgi:hypothetical protein
MNEIERIMPVKNYKCLGKMRYREEKWWKRIVKGIRG